MADYQLNCTWEEVEKAALTPNVFVTMSVRNDPDLGEINVADLTGAQIYGLLQENPKQQIIFTDLSGRQCVMTTPPVNGSSDVKFSVLVGTTLYIYTMPGGTGVVNTETVNISSADAGVMVVYFTSTNSVTEASETYENVMSAAASGKVIIGRYTGNTYYFSGDPDDSGATFFKVHFTNSGQSVGVDLVVLADDESVSMPYRVLSSATIQYTQQSLTDAQKEQARTNIGALGASDIGTVFTLKGSVANVASLPSSGNTVGDVYYVEAVSAGYIWLTNTTYPNGYWEELGETVDLSAYELKPTVVTVTGNTPTIALAENNKIYKCTGTGITSVTITARDTNAAFSVIFDAPSGASAPTFSYPTVNMVMPDDFAVEAYKHYEINVDSEGYAVVGSWSFN